MIDLTERIVDIPDLRNKVSVFRDRAAAGEVLANMLRDPSRRDAFLLAIPAGGVPVAYVVAKRLNIPLDVAIVSKITLPWNTEAGYGAVAFDGTVRVNEHLVRRLSLDRSEIQRGIARTLEKVQMRTRRLRGTRPFPSLANRRAIVVDDGLASGFTMLVAVEALRKAGATQIVVAVPTGHGQSVRRVAAEVDRVYCANIREGPSFAVADAYEHWCDVDEQTALEMLENGTKQPMETRTA